MGRESLTPALVWVCDADGNPFGGGLLIAPDRVLTCAHVVAEALRIEPNTPDAPKELVSVRFTHQPHESPLPAQVVAERWFPAGPLDGDPGAGDIAVIAISETATPDGAAPIRVLTVGTAIGMGIAAYGLPKGHTEGTGGWADGTCRGPQATGWLQVNGLDEGYRIQPGFSGTPAWCDAADGVVGIVVAAERDPEARVSWVIPTLELVSKVPELLAQPPPTHDSRAQGNPTDDRQADLVGGEPPGPPEVRSLVRFWPLPLARNADAVALGVFDSEIAREASGSGLGPYIAREVDGQLDAALGEASFVLVRGDSKAGKSRSAFEVLRRVLPDVRVVVPRDSASLKPMLQPGVRERVFTGSCVLWLDDLQRFLEGSEAIDARDLQDLQELGARVVVLGTIRRTEYQRIKDTTGDVGRAGRDTLACFSQGEITLSQESSRAERLEAERLYPGQTFAEYEGLGEHFAATQRLKEKLEGWNRRMPGGCCGGVRGGGLAPGRSGTSTDRTR